MQKHRIKSGCKKLFVYSWQESLQ